MNTNNEENRYGRFRPPETSDTHEEPSPQTDSEQNTASTPPKSHKKWLALLAIPLLAIAAFLLLRGKDASTGTDGASTAAPAATQAAYNANGFYVADSKLLLVDNSFLASKNVSQSTIEQMYYAFAQAYDAETGARLSDDSSISLLIAFYYTQNSAVDAKLTLVYQLNKDGKELSRKQTTIDGLPDQGILYVSLQDVLSTETHISAGEYTLALLINNQFAYQIPLRIQ